MKTAFVTGGAGFLGLNLIEQLTQENWHVIAIHRPSTNLENLKKFPIELIDCELSDVDRLIQFIPEAVDAIFHLASNTSVWKKHNQQQYQDNVVGTHNMIRAASEKKAKRFIYTSTWGTYGSKQLEINESSPQTGIHSWVNYIKTKSMAEQAVKDAASHGLPAVILNPSHIIGRYDKKNWARIIKLVYHNKLPGIAPGLGSFCHAKQVAKAHISAVENGKIGENYLLGGADASLFDLIQLIGKMTHKSVPKFVTPHWILVIFAHIMQIKATITNKEPDFTPEAIEMTCHKILIKSDKAERELGYQPSSLETMLQDSYDWLKAENLL